MPHRYRLLKMVFKHLSYVGLSQIAVTEIINEFGVKSVSGIAGAYIAQGVGAGMYTAKIGLAVMEVTRPVGFLPENRPTLSAMSGEVIVSLKKLFSDYLSKSPESNVSSSPS